MGKKTVLLAAALAVAGLCILLWPVVSGHRLQADMSAAAQGFLEEARQSYPELLADLQGYNQRIYAERQAGLVDAAACEEPAVELRKYGVEDEVMGVLEIPALELNSMALEKKWIIKEQCQHFLPGVTPEMLDWFWANMEKGYYLWAPGSHKRFNWVKAPWQYGFLNSAHMISETMGENRPVFGGSGVQINRLGLD